MKYGVLNGRRGTEGTTTSSTDDTAAEESNTEEEVVEKSSMNSSTELPRCTWKPEHSLCNHLDSVRSLFFHSTSPLLLSGSEDGSSRLWNVDPASGNQILVPLHSFRGHRGMVTTVTIDDNGNFCITAGADKRILVWDMPPSTIEQLVIRSLSMI